MDSTKIEIVNKSLDRLVTAITEHSDKPTIWSTLIPLLIGAGLTLLTQFLIELWKSDKEKAKQKLELISKGKAKTYLISQLLKELSMYKVHKQYYSRASQIAVETAEKNDSYKKHYEKGQEQRNVESKLSENIAEYFELVTAYTILSEKQDTYPELFKEIFQFEHPKSSKFVDCDNMRDLIAGAEAEELRVNEVYNKLRGLFDSIQNLIIKE